MLGGAAISIAALDCAALNGAAPRCNVPRRRWAALQPIFFGQKIDFFRLKKIYLLPKKYWLQRRPALPGDIAALQLIAAPPRHIAWWEKTYNLFVPGIFVRVFISFT